MHRREMLMTSSAAMLGLSAFPFGWVSAAAEEKKPQKLLYFTRSVEYEHSVVKPDEEGLTFSGKILSELGRKCGFEVDCTKDGRVFDNDLEPYDGIVSYLCGDQYEPSIQKTPPMSATGRKRLLNAIDDGKPFVALHSACYWGLNAPPDDAYTRMVGGQFVAHGAQQPAIMKVVSPDFPGVKGIGGSFRLMDEWYAMKTFAKDLHVILTQDTAGMQGDMYQRPSFPATWARKHGKGRVFFCSMGHREDVWTSNTYQQILLGGIAWALGNIDAAIRPNIHEVTPDAEKLQRP